MYGRLRYKNAGLMLQWLRDYEKSIEYITIETFVAYPVCTLRCNKCNEYN